MESMGRSASAAARSLRSSRPRWLSYPMFSMDLTTPGCGGSAVVALRGDLDVADAATAAARLTAAAVRDRVLIVDLAGLDYIDG
jgi:hypothetical protein